MSDKNIKRWTIAYLILIICTLLFLLLNICIGSVNIAPGEVVAVLGGRSAGSTNSDIIMQIRFPRTIAALFLGGALALSGYLLQTYFHNPIAGPFVLGISSGAKLFVALIMVFCLMNSYRVSSLFMIAAAFVGAMMSVLFVLLISKFLNNMSMLIVGGIMIGYICTAITDFVVTFADDSNIVNLHNWSKGSFSGINWANVQMIFALTMLVFIFVICLSKPIGAYLLGERYAASMGVNIRVFRSLLIVLASLLAACVTAFAGPVSFVGIAVPHLIRPLFKTSKPVVLIPGCFLGGAAFCLLCDLIARVAFAPTELSISTVTAIFGAPIVIYVLIKRRMK